MMINNISDCCENVKVKSAFCTLCKNEASDVSSYTLEHMIKKEFLKDYNCLEGFYYCKNPSCEIIYFNKKTNILQEKLRKEVGLKEYNDSSTVCYCFSWSVSKMKKDILQTGETKALEEIKSKMKTSACACSKNNPSGKCCLKDVKEAIKKIKS